MTNFIFVVGGVISGLGKGVISASLGAILKEMGFKITIKKLDPYLNIDPGTMNPIEHGEVYVTKDGGETDLDLGYYERFAELTLSKNNSTSSGKLLYKLLNNERKGKFLGKTIQFMPHFTNSIQEFIKEDSKDYDFVICEIGGSAGDYESSYFFESIRQMKLNGDKIMICIATYIVYYKITKELKTKPTQVAVKQLMSCGLQPDMLFARSEYKLTNELKKKIALYTNIPVKNIIQSTDVNTIYQVPMEFFKENIVDCIKDHFNIDKPIPTMEKWINLNEKIKSLKNEINVGIIGKYTQLKDSYYSLIEAVEHAGYELDSKINFIWIEAREEFNLQKLENVNCVIIPGGFGTNGIENMIKYITHCREYDIPLLGICLGFQLSVIEYARNILGIKNATSSEFSNIGTFIINKKTNDEMFGGTLRLGEFSVILKEKSMAYEIYKKEVVRERHRHRYELDMNYKKILEEKGMIISGVYREIPEIIEIPDKKFFVCVQYHPEFNSSPFSANPLFVNLLSTCFK